MSGPSEYRPTVTIVSEAPAYTRTNRPSTDLSRSDRARAWIVIGLVAANTLLPVYDLHLLLSGLR